MDWALMMQYDTRLKITDAVRLNKEIDEIWSWLKIDAEHRNLTEALIDVTDASDAPAKAFYFNKKPDCTWSRENPSAK